MEQTEEDLIDLFIKNADKFGVFNFHDIYNKILGSDGPLSGRECNINPLARNVYQYLEENDFIQTVTRTKDFVRVKLSPKGVEEQKKMFR